MQFKKGDMILINIGSKIRPQYVVKAEVNEVFSKYRGGFPPHLTATCFTDGYGYSMGAQLIITLDKCIHFNECETRDTCYIGKKELNISDTSRSAKCTCGGDKTNNPHYNWCDTNTDNN